MGKKEHRNKSTIAEKILRLALFTSMLFGCVPIEATVTTQAPETSPLPTDEITHTPTLSPTEVTPTIENPALEALTLTPEPTATVNPDIEVVDEELAEQIKSVMPSMWVYDREQKNFVERSNEDFKFSIYKKTTLFITDGNGEEVGFARYFVKSSPDAEMTEYYSLTDISKDTVIPIKLYSQMGDYGEPKLSTSGYVSVQKCMYGFAHEFEEVILDQEVTQKALDNTQKYASDIIGMKDGDKLVQIAILRTVANIKGVDELELLKDIENGISIELETKDGNWLVNKGIDIFWSDTDRQKYELDDGKLSLYNGTRNQMQICTQLAWDIAYRTFLSDYFSDDFPEVVAIYRACSQPYTGKYTKQVPVVVGRREN